MSKAVLFMIGSCAWILVWLVLFWFGRTDEPRPKVKRSMKDLRIRHDTKGWIHPEDEIL